MIKSPQAPTDQYYHQLIRQCVTSTSLCVNMIKVDLVAKVQLEMPCSLEPSGYYYVHQFTIHVSSFTIHVCFYC